MVFSRIGVGLAAALMVVLAGCSKSPAPATSAPAPAESQVAEAVDSPAEAPVVAEVVAEVPENAPAAKPAPRVVATPAAGFLYDPDITGSEAMAEVLSEAFEAADVALAVKRLGSVDAGLGLAQEMAGEGLTALLLMTGDLGVTLKESLPTGVQPIALMAPMAPILGIRYIGPDHEAIGRMYGELVQTCIPPGMRIALCTSEQDRPAFRLRRAGLEAQLTSTYQVIYSVLEDGGDPIYLAEQVHELVQDHPEIACFIGFEPHQTEGLVEGLDRAERLGHVRLVTTGFEEPTLIAIQRGWVHGAVVTETGGVGAAVLEAIGMDGGDDVLLPSQAVQNHNLAEFTSARP